MAELLLGEREPRVHAQKDSLRKLLLFLLAYNRSMLSTRALNLWRIPMPIKDVVSPVSRKGSRVGSVASQPLSPGARSAPGRGDQTETPAAEPQLQRRDRAATHQEPPMPSSTPVTIGPEE
jgi:hypothetical protein